MFNKQYMWHNQRRAKLPAKRRYCDDKGQTRGKNDDDSAGDDPGDNADDKLRVGGENDKVLARIKAKAELKMQQMKFRAEVGQRLLVANGLDGAWLL
jgi:hypothetical protein